MAEKQRSSRKYPALKTPFSSNKYTPYSRTPKTARSSRLPRQCVDIQGKKSCTRAEENTKDSTNVQRASSPDVNKENSCRIETPCVPIIRKEITRVTDDIKSVVGKTWRVNRCSPLYNFSYKSQALQRYSKLLNCHLELASSRNAAFEIGEASFSGKLKAEFKVLKDFGMYETDSPGVQINIYSRATTSSKTKKPQPVFTAVLCCVGNEDRDSRFLNETFTCLPLCLVKGPAALTKAVFSWLEEQFDCKVSSLWFSPTDLAWYAGFWAGIVPSDSAHNLELCYSLPAQAKGLSRITYAINAHDAKELWDCNHTDDSLIVTEEETTNFIKSLEIHFDHHFKINLTGLSLSCIANSVAFIGKEGRIKILQAEYVRHVLQQVTKLALEMEFYGRI